MFCHSNSPFSKSITRGERQAEALQKPKAFTKNRIAFSYLLHVAGYMVNS